MVDEKLGIELQTLPMSTADDIDAAFAAMSAASIEAFFVSASSLSRSQRKCLAELALKCRLPSMFGIRDNVEAGGRARELKRPRRAGSSSANRITIRSPHRRGRAASVALRGRVPWQS